ncbi:MAG: manganese-binding transcriptional regulator MntR [Hyphomicrobiaceae bacterium]|nr:manganese-binding transcriptional regulator MntR [Hyphomicrobiaceae bacterium]
MTDRDPKAAVNPTPSVPDTSDPVRQAERFQRVREAHQTEVAEDYVELIADLIDRTGEARVVDLASHLGVTNATVNNTVQRLVRDGLVTTRPYRSIFLTDSGREMAEVARSRHALVLDFLLALGVDRETAELDAEGIEHHVSEATLSAFKAFVARARRGARPG